MILKGYFRVFMPPAFEILVYNDFTSSGTRQELAETNCIVCNIRWNFFHNQLMVKVNMLWHFGCVIIYRMYKWSILVLVFSRNAVI